MAYPEFLATGWQDNVRAACGGVSIIDVPDALLALDLYGQETEDAIKKLLPTWATLKATPAHATNFNRASVRHVAAKVCIYLKVKLPETEKIGADYSYTLQKVDWDKLEADNLAKCYEYLGLIDPACVEDLTYIDVAQRDPAFFDGLVVEEIE
jgi:hypothetical protein